jgi:hypothetical protein
MHSSLKVMGRGFNFPGAIFASFLYLIVIRTENSTDHDEVLIRSIYTFSFALWNYSPKSKAINHSLDLLYFPRYSYILVGAIPILIPNLLQGWSRPPNPVTMDDHQIVGWGWLYYPCWRGYVKEKNIGLRATSQIATSKNVKGGSKMRSCL